MSILSLAYSSNLCISRLQQRLEKATPCSTGKRRGYVHGWHMASTDGSGKQQPFLIDLKLLDLIENSSKPGETP